MDTFEDIFALDAGDAAGYGCGFGCGIGKCSANVDCLRRKWREVKGRKFFVFMEPAPGLEPGTY